MHGLPIIELPAKEHLRILQRLDRAHDWESLREQRRCRACGDVFSGREVEIVGGTRGYGPLRLQCPTYRCWRGPESWDVVLPSRPETTTAGQGLKVSHGGRACTLQRVRHLDAQRPSAEHALRTTEWIGTAMRRLRQLLHTARPPAGEPATLLSHGLTKG
jgi:hypothetical protein